MICSTPIRVLRISDRIVIAPSWIVLTFSQGKFDETITFKLHFFGVSPQRNLIQCGPDHLWHLQSRAGGEKLGNTCQLPVNINIF